MKIKHQDIEIPADDPFANCKLGRKKYAEALTGIISSYADGFVLAINNEWGTGKTTFIRMWRQYLNNEGFKTLYFNAWENDFEANPLVAILSELKTLAPKRNDATFKKLLKKGASITKTVLPAVIEAFAKKYIDAEGLVKAIGKLTEAATDILKEEVDEYANKKKGLIEFRNELQTFIAKANNEKPLVFFIDELDRCRPNYAVEVLEQVKHFFSVPGIIFVLSIDKPQLGNAVRGFYGSEQINADEYLRRFIDLEYVIPVPETGVFCNYLYSYYGFNEFLYSEERRHEREFQHDKSHLIKFAVLLFEKSNATLRQQEKLFAHARVVLNLFKDNNYIFPTLYILLIFTKTFERTLYEQLRNRQVSTQDLLIKMKFLYPNEIQEDDLGFFTYTEALLATFYNNYYCEINRNSSRRLFERDKETGQNKLRITSAIATDTHFLDTLEAISRKNHDGVSLSFLLNKIELLETLSV